MNPAAIDPWFFPSDNEYGALLRAHGFVVETIKLFPRPTPLPGDISGWLRTFAQPFLGALSAEQRVAVVGEVTERLRPALYESGRGWTADYVRLRLRASR